MAPLFKYCYGILAITMALLQSAEALTGVERQDAIRTQNAYRKIHKVNALGYSYALENYAKRTTDKCQMVSSGGPYGENMALGFPTVKDAVNAWYNESKSYDYFNNPVFSANTGHFTQMVWKETTIMGCYVGACNNYFKGAQMIVCCYSKPGNIISSDNGFFKANVLPP